MMKEPLDFDEIRRDAEAAVEEFNHHWGDFLEAVRRVEARPQNQSGADKTWVDRARAAYRDRYRDVVRVERARS